MSKTKDLKSRCKDVWVLLKHLFKSPKVLDQATVNQELILFMQQNGYDKNNQNFDCEKFRSEFAQYLKDKNYIFQDIDVSLEPFGNKKNSDDTQEENVIESLKHVHEITEDLNDIVDDINVFLDTTKMMPGHVCYAIEKIYQQKTNRM